MSGKKTRFTDSGTYLKILEVLKKVREVRGVLETIGEIDLVSIETSFRAAVEAGENLERHLLRCFEAAAYPEREVKRQREIGDQPEIPDWPSLSGAMSGGAGVSDRAPYEGPRILPAEAAEGEEEPALAEAGGDRGEGLDQMVDAALQSEDIRVDVFLGDDAEEEGGVPARSTLDLDDQEPPAADQVAQDGPAAAAAGSGTVQLARNRQDCNLQGLELPPLRQTPEGEKTVSDLVMPGMLVWTSYGSGPYYVQTVARRVFNTPSGPAYYWELECANPEEPFARAATTLTELVAVDGRILKLMTTNDDEVLLSEPAPAVLPGQSYFKETLDDGTRVWLRLPAGKMVGRGEHLTGVYTVPEGEPWPEKPEELAFLTGEVNLATIRTELEKALAPPAAPPVAGEVRYDHHTYQSDGERAVLRFHGDVLTGVYLPLDCEVWPVNDEALPFSQDTTMLKAYARSLQKEGGSAPAATAKPAEEKRRPGRPRKQAAATA